MNMKSRRELGDTLNVNIEEGWDKGIEFTA